MGSPPARGRGLKQQELQAEANDVGSPPARGRGLKRNNLPEHHPARWSPPARGRGLKRVLLDGDYRYAERLDQKLTLREKLDWALRAEIDNMLDEWMAKQGKQNGFTIVKDNHGKPKLQNSAYQWHALTGKAAKGKKSGFSTVDFTGDLVVSDVEAFKKALFNGIGRSKAFGCGLMLVKRI